MYEFIFSFWFFAVAGLFYTLHVLPGPLLAVQLIFYFFLFVLPTFIAMQRKSQYLLRIFLVNVFLGSNLLVWIILLLYSLLTTKKASK